LTAYEKFPEPREVEELKVTANKKELGTAFKKDAKTIADALEALPEDEAECLRKSLESGKQTAFSWRGLVVCFCRGQALLGGSGPLGGHRVGWGWQQWVCWVLYAANKKELGTAFKKDAKAIADALEALPEDEAECLRKSHESGESGSSFCTCFAWVVAMGCIKLPV
jgi:glycyl-tRNA synthetase (class II)